MAVKIRLQRRGRVHLPQYDIVVADSRSARDKKFIQKIGYHHPLARGAETPFVLDAEALNTWIAKGAQVTDVVARLLVKQGVAPEKVKAAYEAKKQRRIKAQDVIAKAKAAKEAKLAAKEAAANAPAEEAAPAAPAEAPAEAAPAAEAPAEQPAA
ncbi:MAG: 30S ribosomal protein S16 [Pseudomonadaceae bacterium]|nr:30S ribosomal protein S16 [Pseudomonadaceae bacterium]